MRRKQLCLWYIRGGTCLPEIQKCCKVKLQRQATCHDSASFKNMDVTYSGSMTQRAVSPCRKLTVTFLFSEKSTTKDLASYDADISEQHVPDAQRPRGVTSSKNRRTGWHDTQTSAGAHCAASSCTKINRQERAWTPQRSQCTASF